MTAGRNVARGAFCRLVGSSLLLSAAAGCGGGSTAATTNAAAAPAPLGSMALQLGWVEDAQYAGTFIAESRGYYRAQGVDVVIRPGGPDIAVEPIVVSGAALVGLSTAAQVAQARVSGAPLKIVAAWPRDPEVFISLAHKPITTPRELIGKRIGVPSIDRIDATGFLKVNGIGLDQVHFIPVEYDPGPLAAGEVDAYFGFSTNEAISLVLRGVPVHEMRVDDFGYSGLFGTYSVHEASLADPHRRAQIAAFLRGERRGWEANERDPAAGTDLTVHTYGATLALDPKQQLLESRATNALLTSPGTHAHGLFWMSPQQMDRTIAQLRLEGVTIGVAELFDPSLIDEIDQPRATTAS
jgi:ABC-type nitrate/sulfonate/bicarbonate transport system substrate-binding protein